MPRLTVTITEEQDELLTDLSADDGPYESKSAAVREFITDGEQRRELEREVDRLTERLEARGERIDELEEQLRQRRNRIDTIEEEIEDLPARLADEQSQRGAAPFFVRWYQWYRNRGG